jgi:hypothetical protein
LDLVLLATILTNHAAREWASEAHQ